MQEPRELSGLTPETWSILGGLARALHLRNAELQPTLDAIVSVAVRTIGSAQYAGLILLVAGRLLPQATTGTPPHDLDLFQRDVGNGPCIAAASQQTVVRLDDMGDDLRWPAFAERARSLGVVSMLCAPLWVAENRLGTLSLYSDRPSAFTEHDLQLTCLYATHAALALADAQRAEKLQIAVRNRDLIGQAKGILMERFRLTPDAAFRKLSSASQAANVKLTAVAQHLVDTGELL